MATKLDQRRKAPYSRQELLAALTPSASLAASVATPSARYRELDELRRLPRALMGGTRAMRAAGEEFLPRHAAESPESYDMRLKSATLYNGYEQTVERQTGKMFVKPVVLEDDVPPELEVLTENIDAQGRALTPFAFDLTKHGMVDGVSYILVDMPPARPLATRADQIIANARPYWVLVTAAQLIGWRTSIVAGKAMLTQARIRETTCEESGAYGEQEVERIRVLEPGRWELWRRVKGAKEEWALEDEGVSSLPYIPLVPVYVNRTAFFEGEPPLRTLAELNQEHWISSSEQRYALTFSRFAMLKVTGASDEAVDIVIGPNKALLLPSGADASFIEHSGAGINAGREDLASIEQRMASAGMLLRVERGGEVTATAALIDSEETNAGLRAVANGIGDSIEQALQVTADYLGLKSGGSVQVYDGFAKAPPQGSVTELTSLSTLGKLSLPTLWEELKRRQVLADDFDPEVEFQRLMIEQAMMAPEPALTELGSEGKPPPDGAASPDAANPDEPPSDQR